MEQGLRSRASVALQIGQPPAVQDGVNIVLTEFLTGRLAHEKASVTGNEQGQLWVRLT
jgi:hypothetical protein